MAHGFITGQVTASYAITASYALNGTGGSSYTIETKTTSFNVSNTIFGYVCSGSSIVASLPSAATFGSKEVNIKNVSSSLATVTSSLNEIVDGNGIPLSQYESLRLMCDGSKYYII